MPLHYTNSGNLDMRYSSSHAAVASSSGGGYRSSGSSLGSSLTTSNSGGLNYTKSGNLDMRYNSSHAAVTSSVSEPGNNLVSSGYLAADSDGLHYTKDGNLDMRFSSSKQAVGASGSSVAEVELKKDGTPDMRFTSSRQLVGDFGHLKVTSQQQSKTGSTYNTIKAGTIPSHVPLTKSGLPDMRTKEAKEWVVELAQTQITGIPAWLPTKKDGALDTSKAVVQQYLKPISDHGKSDCQIPFNHNLRDNYYENKINDMLSDFKCQVENARREFVEIPVDRILPETAKLSEQFRSAQSSIRSGISQEGSSDLASLIHGEIPSNIPEIDYNLLKQSFPDESTATLGRGTFGIVFKGTWNGRAVAVKRLHLNQLTTKDKQSFVTEMKILALVGDHPNLVKLFGYSLNPPAFVMEYAQLGSLSYLLHYCEDNSVEAKLTDGRIKQRLLVGIAAGMRQIHAVGVVHGDLKTANILVSAEYVAKVTDFGLASLRGKTSSSTVSTAMSTADDGENVIGGTGGYMDPNLLDSSSPPDYSSDVYSFGILFNEIIQEEEPYSGEEAKFHGRGPFGAANYAKLGNRPHIKGKTPAPVKKLIEDCWKAKANLRPTFLMISNILAMLAIPNSF